MRHGGIVANAVYFLRFSEVEQPEAVEVDAHAHKFVCRNVGRVGGAYEVFKLRDDGCLRAFVAAAHVHAYHYVRCEVGAHDVQRIVVVDSAVVKQASVHLRGLEYARKAHRCAHGASEVATRKHYFAFLRRPRSHAAERHHQAVEIASASSSIGRKKTHELEVHGQRRDETRRHGCGRVAAADVEGEHGGRRCGRTEII